MLHFITRVSRHFIFWSLILLAGLLISLRILLFCFDFYKAELETKLTDLLHVPVKIGQIHAYLRHGLKPELVLKNLRLVPADGTQPPIELQEIRLGIDLIEILTKQQLIPATWITLVGAKLSLIQKTDGSFAIVGLTSSNEQPAWLLEGRHYQLLQSQITWLDQKNQRPAATFKQVDISIQNNLPHQQHQLNILSQLPGGYGDTLKIALNLSGDFFNSNNLNATLFVAGKNLQFAKLLAEPLPLALQIKSGSGNLALWGTVQNSQLTALSGQLHSKNLTLQRSDRKKLQFTRLNTRFDWRNQANRWDLAVDDLSISLANKRYPSAQFRLGSPNKTAQHIGANIKQLDLAAVQTVGEFLSADMIGFKNLSGFNLTGQLRDTVVFADLKQQHYAINGLFQHLSLAAAAPYPQLQNLSGTIVGTEQRGLLMLNSHHANFVAQPMFRTPLAMTKVAGQLHWQQSKQNWFLSSAKLQLNTPYAESISQLKVTIPKNAQPTFVDLQSAFFNLNDVSNAKTYFPVTLMSSGLLHYLDEAFIKGQVKRGDLLLHGYLKDFPFTQHQGVFQVLFEAQDVTMKYAQDWPLFEHINARVLFENDGLEIHVKQAQVEPQRFPSLRINNAKIGIPSFTDSHYVFVQEGLANAEMNQGLDFLRHTPLTLPLQAVSEQLAINGNTQVKLDLQIPLTDIVTPKVTGSAQVTDAQLKVLAVDLPIDHLSGVFRFNENGFYSDTLQALGLGYPLQAKVSLKPDSTVIDVEGRTGIKELTKQFALPKQAIAQGASDYSVQLNLPFADRKSPELTIRSDLQGISLALPDSLAKKTTEAKPLELKFDLSKTALLPVNLSYANQLQATVLIEKENKKLAAASLLLGENLPDFDNREDFHMPLLGEFGVKINQAHFSAPTWFSVLNNIAMDAHNTPSLTELEIHTPELEWEGQKLGLLDLKLQQHSEMWSGTLDCAAAKGRLEIPINRETDNKIKLNMEQLDLSSLMRLSLPKQMPNVATHKPLFEITSQKLFFRGINLGKLELDSERTAQGIKFKHFAVTGKEQSLTLNGDWQVLNNQEVCFRTASPLKDWQSCPPQEITQVNGKLVAENFGNLLKKLHLNTDFEETDAQITLDLHWAGAPYQFALDSLSGTMDIQLENGRISSIEPGIGRLLGVLAMEQWLKRVKLDFSDIYQEGLSFNNISGHFSLLNGKASSENLTVDAVPATITLMGELNLPQQTLDQQISVIPKSSDAVPIAGTIVGGIATLVAQTLTGEQEPGYYLRSKYRVKGKWNDLNIVPLHEQDGLLKKTWRGLTDFSWITQPEQD